MRYCCLLSLLRLCHSDFKFIIQELGQCLHCGLTYKYLKGTKCGQCEHRSKLRVHGAIHQFCSQLVRCLFHDVTDTENINCGSLKGKPEIITIDSSDFENEGDDDETKLQPLRDAVNQNRKIATQLRLTRKTEKPTIPERTKAFLKARELARQQDPSKLGTILFKCELVLQKQTGQKQGTRVPMETRGFSVQEVSDKFRFPRWLLTPESFYRRSAMFSTNLR